MVSNSAPPTCLNSPAGSLGTAGSVNKLPEDKADSNPVSTKEPHNVRTKYGGHFKSNACDFFILTHLFL